MDQIKNRLRALGFKDTDLPKIINDVNVIALKKMMNKEAEQINDEMKATLNSLSDKQLDEYLELHKSEIPSLSKGDITAILVATWEDYFQEMGEVSA